MSARYPAHVPAPLAEVLGMPPHQLALWWRCLRDVGVDIPTRYEGEVSAALHFLIPFALRDGAMWEAAAGAALLRMKDGVAFAAETLAVAPTRDVAPTEMADALIAAVHGLRSFQYGNGSTEFAASIADTGDAILRAAGYSGSVPVPAEDVAVRRQQGMSVEIEDGRLVIAIGIDALMTAIDGGPHAPEDLDYRIVDRDGFAHEIVAQLRDEEEDGTTPVHRLFDDATEHALDAGSLCVEYDEPERGAD